MKGVHPSDHPFPEPDPCPLCKRGIVLECNFGWWCSRRYDKDDPCDWTQGEHAPTPKAETPNPDHARHVRKHNRALWRPHGALDPRKCNTCGKTICCMYGQRAVTDPAAPGGVWLLHPHCPPPRAERKRERRRGAPA